MVPKKIDFLKIANYLKLATCLILLGCCFIPFAPGLKMVVKSSSGNVVTTYSPAFSFIFGGNLASEHITYKTIGCSPLGIIGYIFIVLALVGVLVSIFTVRSNKKRSKIIFFISLGLTLASAIMMFCMHRSAATVLADAIMGEHSDAVANTIYNNTSLQFGFLGVGIFGLLATLGLTASLFFDGTIDKIKAFIISKM